MSAERGGFLVKRAVRGGGGPRRKKAAAEDDADAEAEAAAGTEPATGASLLRRFACCAIWPLHAFQGVLLPCGWLLESPGGSATAAAVGIRANLT